MEEKLEDRFKASIDEQRFNLFEIAGFRDKPNLALLAGMALGYKMGMDDTTKAFNKIKEMAAGR